MELFTCGRCTHTKVSVTEGRERLELTLLGWCRQHTAGAESWTCPACRQRRVPETTSLTITLPTAVVRGFTEVEVPSAFESIVHDAIVGYTESKKKGRLRWSLKRTRSL